MHTSTTMKTAEFGFATTSGPVQFDEAFGWFATDERVGVVVAEPGDGIRAAPLHQTPRLCSGLSTIAESLG